jgi:hypothetical protein
MNLNLCITRLAASAAAIDALLEAIDDEQARWKPSTQAWSMLEVICHLYDEERKDFRPRLDVLLHRLAEAPPPIDPERWVTARNYQARDFQIARADFQRERQASLAWLHTLSAPDWTQNKTISVDFVLHAGDMLASWVAHDFLHMRQLVELHYAYHAEQAQPYAVGYAGAW